MMNEVYKNIYQVEIPLVGNPLKALNSYIILGEGEGKSRDFLIIDTGFNMPECEAALMGALDTLGLDLTRGRLLVTHLHSDHSGLAAELSRRGMARVMTGHIDGAMINEMTEDSYWRNIQQRAAAMDLLKDGIEFGEHPGYRYCPKTKIDFEGLGEGDSVTVGHYNFRVLDIPGHTPGHIALYDEAEGLLISGDHILDPITPNIAFWGFEWDILDVYFQSLKKIRALDVKIVLTSHRKIITNHVDRIDTLRMHHDERLVEIEGLIRDWRSVRDTAKGMRWDLRAASWSEFPAPQKWFASAEAMSHLEHLYRTGRADRRDVKGILEYRATESVK